MAFCAWMTFTYNLDYALHIVLLEVTIQCFFNSQDLYRTAISGVKIHPFTFLATTVSTIA